MKIWIHSLAETGKGSLTISDCLSAQLLKGGSIVPVRPYMNLRKFEILSYVHTAPPFSFLSVFVDENAFRSHCSFFK